MVAGCYKEQVYTRLMRQSLFYSSEQNTLLKVYFEYIDMSNILNMNK